MSSMVVDPYRFAVSFVPTDISGCKLWLDASDTATISDTGGLVDTWSDKSGQSNNFTGSGTQRPTTSSVTINSLNALEFMFAAGSTGDYMTAGSNFASGFTAGTIFLVVKSTVSASQAITYFQCGSNTSPFHPFGNGLFYESFGSTVRRDAINVSAFTLTNAHVYSVAAASNDWAAYINGTSISSTGTNTVSFAVTPTLGSGPNGYGGMNFGEVLIYNSKLSSGDQSTVKSYLATKWGTP